MKKKAFQILLCCHLLMLLPSVLYELAEYSIINLMDFFTISPLTMIWLGINLIYGLFFLIPAVVIICVSTLIIIKEEHKKENMAEKSLFIWLIVWNFVVFIDILRRVQVFVAIIVIICINTLIMIKKEHKKGNLIKQNLFIWLILWVLNIIAILCSFDLGMFIGRQ